MPSSRLVLCSSRSGRSSRSSSSGRCSTSSSRCSTARRSERRLRRRARLVAAPLVVAGSLVFEADRRDPSAFGTLVGAARVGGLLRDAVGDRRDGALPRPANVVGRPLRGDHTHWPLWATAWLTLEETDGGRPLNQTLLGHLCPDASRSWPCSSFRVAGRSAHRPRGRRTRTGGVAVAELAKAQRAAARARPSQLRRRRRSRRSTSCRSPR